MPFVSPPVYVPTYMSWADTMDAVKNGVARRIAINLIVCRLYQAQLALLPFFTNAKKTAHVCRPKTAKRSLMPGLLRSLRFTRLPSPREARTGVILLGMAPVPID